MSEDLYERLDRIEKLLEKLLKRINQIEEVINNIKVEEEGLDTALRLVMGFSLPVFTALESSRRVILILKSLGRYTSLSRNIIEALSDCKPKNLSEITRDVRILRGTASRRLIRERIMDLINKGIAIKISNSHIARYTLKICIEQEH